MDLEKIFSLLESTVEDEQVASLQELYKLPASEYPSDLGSRVDPFVISHSPALRFWAKRLLKRIGENSPPGAIAKASTTPGVATPGMNTPGLKTPGSATARQETAHSKGPCPKPGKSSPEPEESPAEKTEEPPTDPTWALPDVNGASPEAVPSQATSEVESDADAKPLVQVTFDLLMSADIQASSTSAIGCLTKLLEQRRKEDLPRFLEYLKSCTEAVQISFLVKNIPATFPDEDLLTLIGPYLRHPDDRVIANAIEGIGFIKSPKTVVLISQVLGHNSHRVRANAGRVLREFDPESSKTVLARMFQMSDKPHFVIAACHSAKVLKAPEYLPILADLVRDPLICDAALDAIGGIGGNASLKFLEQLLQTESQEVQDKIRETAERIRLDENSEKVQKVVSETVEAGKKILGKVAGWFSKNPSTPHQNS